jgi:hypothetical protein
LEGIVEVFVASETDEPTEMTFGGGEGVKMFCRRARVGSKGVMNAVQVEIHGASREQRKAVE